MSVSALKKDIMKTQGLIDDSAQLLTDTCKSLAAYEIEEPYCYLLPATAFLLGYQLHDHIPIAQLSRYLLPLIKIK